MTTDTMVDRRDMIVVHTALLRELRLAPRLVERGGPHTREHVAFVLDLLEHHHAGEDRLLWPVLRGRVPPQMHHLLDHAGEQHREIEELLEAARSEPDDDRLAVLLRRLHDVVAEHLDAEERDVLPLAALHLTQAEWAAIGENGATAVPRTKLPLLFGMFMYDGDPDVVRHMLSSAPPLVRALLPRIAPRAYARYCRRLHGTRNPSTR
jgi:hemerythrin-like domain-containing protein